MPKLFSNQLRVYNDNDSNVDQVLSKMYVQQARGNDIFKYHKHTKRPISLMSSEDIKIRKKANEDLQEIFYSSSTKRGFF